MSNFIDKTIEMISPEAAMRLLSVRVNLYACRHADQNAFSKRDRSSRIFMFKLRKCTKYRPNSQLTQEPSTLPVVATITKSTALFPPARCKPANTASDCAGRIVPLEMKR